MRRDYLGLDCVFCSPGSNTFYLGISPGGWANCWRCGPLKLYDVLLALGFSKAEAYKAVKGLSDGPRTRSDRRTGKMSPPKTEAVRAAHIDYLKRRGFDPEEVVRLWGVKGTGISPEKGMSWRLYLPVLFRGKEVSWTTRAIGDDVEPRYFSAPLDREALPHKELLYGWDYVRHAAVVHEGPIDCWRTGPGAVSTFGVGYSRAQVALLASVPVRAICFDNEPKAYRRACDLADELSGFPGDTFVVQLDSDDPGCATPREVETLRSYLK